VINKRQTINYFLKDFTGVISSRVSRLSYWIQVMDETKLKSSNFVSRIVSSTALKTISGTCSGRSLHGRTL
jgi:hypothetical protein